jgi:hypothetical protein
MSSTSKPTPPTDPRARRLYESARRLATLEAERNRWANLAKALSRMLLGKSNE